MARTAIVILNWNGLNFLEKFLPSVILHSQGAEIVIADNKSTDGSVQFLRNAFAQVRIIETGSNEGYSKGYNVALSQVDAEYYVLLNSDVEVTSGWLHPIIDLMDSDPLIAACQPKIKSYHHKDLFEYAGAAGGFIDKFGYPFCRGRIFDHLEQDNGQYNDVREIFWATGACLFIRSAVYWKMTGLDNDFFAHMEEIDLCWRIKNAGFKIYYFGLSEVFHVGGGTLDKSSPTKTYLNFRNGLSLLYKNLPQKKIKKIIFIRMLLDGIAAFKFLLFDSYAHFWAVMRAHSYYYKNKKAMKEKRKMINSLIEECQYDSHLIYPGSIVKAYFFQKKKTFSQLNWLKNS